MARIFCGTYEHQIDEKGRIRIPPKFRKMLTGDSGEKTYSFARGLNNCIYIFPDEVLEEILEKVTDEKIGNSTKGSLLFFSNIYAAEEDSQGRVTIPPRLRKMAKINKDIVTIGRGNRIEIWSAESYDEYIDESDYDQLVKELDI